MSSWQGARRVAMNTALTARANLPHKLTIYSGLISFRPPLFIEIDLLRGPEWAARRHGPTHQAILDCLCIRVVVCRVGHVLVVVQKHAVNLHVIDIDVAKHWL